jgi:hypothetical protein
MTELSPAQKALAAFKERHELSVLVDDDWVEQCLAAALEAVADQVVPEEVEPPCGETEPWPQGYQLMRDAQWEKCQQLRSEILAIAAELRGNTTETL